MSRPGTGWAAARAIVLAAAALTACAPTPRANILAAVASTDRPQADVQRDAARKPALLAAFADIRPGATVADIIPGTGYFTRIFSKIVGPAGRVYAVLPAGLMRVAPRSADPVRAIAADPAFGNVVVFTPPAGTLSPPVPVDLAWISDDYHGLYAISPEAARRLDTDVFSMLRPGGIFIVIDHVGKPGASGTSAKTLFRIDPATVKAQVLSAGFTLEGESSILRNAADTHEASVFAPEIRGHTDQFVMKFRKPPAP